jgi:hypothetical protein
MPLPHPELDGHIFSTPGDPRIWWIDQGFARHIPDEATYHGVFGSSPTKMSNSSLAEISVGADIEKGAALVRGDNESEIYFVEQKVKRFIPTEHIKAIYQFNGNVHSVPLGVLNSLQDGPQFVDPHANSDPNPNPGTGPDPVPSGGPFPDPTQYPTSEED